MGTRILVVEDEPAIAETLVYALRTEGLVPVWCATAAAATADRQQHGDPALVILDVGLPDAHGFDWCRQLRRESEVPVLFLTAREAEVDRVAGLELGADDYVTKPFSPREVVARVRAILRRGRLAAPTPPGASGAATGGLDGEKPVPGAAAFAVAEDQARLRYHGVPVALTRQELSLLLVLLSRPGRVWSRDDLLNRAWQEPAASADRTVDAHIKLLRNKLRAIRAEPDPIITYRGLGYALRRDS